MDHISPPIHCDRAKACIGARILDDWKVRTVVTRADRSERQFTAFCADCTS
jgi:hypothetical protein